MIEQIIILSLIIFTFGFDAWLSILNYKNKDAEIPEEVKDVYDEKEYQNWLKYNMENFRFSLIVKTIHFIIIIAFLVLGIFPFIFDLARQITSQEILQILIFLGILYLGNFIIGIFTSYYQQFSIEERFGFNKTTIKTFIADKIKGLILSAVLGGGIIYLLALLYLNVGTYFYITAWALVIGLIMFINLFYVKLFIPLFNKLRPLEDGELKTKIVEFANSVGYEITKISIIDASKRSTKLNAFFSGFGKFKQVVLYDTLLDKMTDDQIVGVLAHEIGHAKKKHIIKNLFISIVTISMFLFLLLYCVNSKDISIAFGFDNPTNAEAFGFGLIVFLLLLSPISIILELITSHISRKFEYEADAYTAFHGYKVELQEALKVLSRANYSNLTPHPLYVKMRYSHPPVAYRIRAIEQVNK